MVDIKKSVSTRSKFGIFVTIIIIMLFLLIMIIINMVKFKLVNNTMFYLITLICVAWWVIILFASRLLGKHNRTNIAGMLALIGFAAGFLGSDFVGDIFLNRGTLFIGIFAFICLLSGFIVMLKQRKDSNPG
jgi:hypothetical protein